jgi:glycosyltransferase involved in cell wall biosynthesis
MTKPRVLYVVQNHPHVQPGGAEGYALDLYEAMQQADDFEPLFLARTGPPFSSVERTNTGTPFASVNDDPNQYFFYTNFTDPTQYDLLFGRPRVKSMLTRFFRDFLLAHRPDVVHFQHSLFIGFDAIRVVRNTLPDTPILYMLHEYLPICTRDGQFVRTIANERCEHESPRRCHECFPEISPQTFFMRKRFIQSHFELVDKFIAPSEYVKQRYVDWGIPAEKIFVHTYACRPVERPPEPAVDRSRNRFAFFGQFTPYKGADVLLRAMETLGRDFPGHLWMYGANLDRQPPEFKEKFGRMLEEIGDTVTMAGHYDHADVGKLMMGVDWVIVPSIWWETGPIVVLEAFQYGRPVICSDIGGMSEKVTDGVNGIHFRRGDPDSLAAALSYAAGTPGLWERMSAAVAPVPRIADHASVLTEIYKELMATRARERLETEQAPVGTEG